MHVHSPKRNIGVTNGEWGENVAVEHLRLAGMEIVDRNVRPYARDRRLEIDIIAYDPPSDAMVFVEVKQHSRHFAEERRIRSVDREKLHRLRTACNAWRRHNRWDGNYRFDVVEVFGSPGTRAPEVDHIRRVNLFTPANRFVGWD